MSYSLKIAAPAAVIQATPPESRFRPPLHRAPAIAAAYRHRKKESKSKQIVQICCICWKRWSRKTKVKKIFGNVVHRFENGRLKNVVIGFKGLLITMPRAPSKICKR